jgi:hypothetical protein
MLAHARSPSTTRIPHIWTSDQRFCWHRSGSPQGSLFFGLDLAAPLVFSGGGCDAMDSKQRGSCGKEGNDAKIHLAILILCQRMRG